METAPMLPAPGFRLIVKKGGLEIVQSEGL